MKSSNHWLGKQISVLLISLLAFCTGESGSALAQQQPAHVNPQNALPGVAKAQQPPQEAQVAEGELPDNPEPGSGQAPAQPQPAVAPPSGASQSQDKEHKPVGTAAAPYEPTVGIAASRPAGAAIAPAKQRRVRTILISLGVIAGAGIAIGSVAALSHGSPSRP
jgi:hypothetical protein